MALARSHSPVWLAMSFRLGYCLQYFFGALLAFDLGGLAHVAMDHDDIALPAEPLGDVLHGDAGRFDVVGAHKGRGFGGSFRIDVDNRDARGLRFGHGRGAGFYFAGVHDDGVDALSNEAFHLLDLLEGRAFGVYGNQFTPASCAFFSISSLTLTMNSFCMLSMVTPITGLSLSDFSLDWLQLT